MLTQVHKGNRRRHRPAQSSRRLRHPLVWGNRRRRRRRETDSRRRRHLLREKGLEWRASTIPS